MQALLTPTLTQLTALWLSATAASPCTEPLHHRGDLVVGPQGVPACLETIDGNLLIDKDAPQVVNLSGLTDVRGELAVNYNHARGLRTIVAPQLERVGGPLNIKGYFKGGKVSLGLNSLSYIGGHIGFDLSGKGFSATGLNSLRRHSAGVWVFGEGDLRGVLTGLEMVESTVFIRQNHGKIPSFPALQLIGGNLILNSSLARHPGSFEQLKEVEGSLYLFGGRPSFAKLQRVHGTVALRGTQVKDLSSIARGLTAGGLMLSDNQHLSRLPVSALRVVEGDVHILNNKALSTCAARDFIKTQKNFGWRGKHAIEDNRSGKCAK